MKNLLFLGTVLLAMNVSAQSKKDLEVQVESLNTEVQNLKTQLDETRAKLDNSRAKYERCIEGKEEMMERQNQFMRQNQKLQRSIDSLNAVAQQASSGKITNPQNAMDSMRMIVQLYLATSNPDDRYKYVIHNQSTLDKMKKYYYEGVNGKEVEKEKIGMGQSIGKYTLIKYGSSAYYLLKPDNGYAIDWEASVGFNDVNLNAFKANSSLKTVTIYADVQLRNLYNWNYTGKESSYWSVRISDPIQGFAWGYVRKSSATGKQIYDLLSHGLSHRAIIEISSDRTEDTSGGTVVITKLVDDNWVTE